MTKTATTKLERALSNLQRDIDIIVAEKNIAKAACRDLVTTCKEMVLWIEDSGNLNQHLLDTLLPKWRKVIKANSK